MAKLTGTLSKGPNKPSASVLGSVLQRKCACGTGVSFSSECQACRSNRLFGVQTKLRISSPGDFYELEADRVAEAVVKTDMADIDENQRSRSATPLIQHRVWQGGDGFMEAPPVVDATLLSSGQPLDRATRGFMESRFGHDFGQVRIHTDSKAAESASAIGALAYTVGRDVVFSAGAYAPHTSEGRKTLAHELAHTVQQSLSSRPHTVQRLAVSDSCDEAHARDVESALDTARTWRRQASAWLRQHLEHLRRRTPRDVSLSSTLGSVVFDELSLLDRHFRISDIIHGSGGRFPTGMSDRVSTDDLEIFGNASNQIRARFLSVDLSGLLLLCEVRCRRGRRTGGTVPASVTVPGSHEFTIYTDCFDILQPHEKAGVILHEAFHASFDEFSNDVYSHEPDYPGPSPLTNADSFATFAPVVSTGSSYRMLIGPAIEITGSTVP